MKKDQQENLRVDMLTKQLVYALCEQTELNKSDVYRTAVYRMAKELLPADEFNKLVLAFNDIEKM